MTELKKALGDDSTLLHISPKKNRSSILKNGLLTGKENSGYGIIPKHNAVYLFHPNNINVMYDMINLFHILDVYEIDIGLLEDRFIPDEDSGETTAVKSLSAHGTIGYQGNIPADVVTLMLSVENKKWKKQV